MFCLNAFCGVEMLAEKIRLTTVTVIANIPAKLEQILLILQLTHILVRNLVTSLIKVHEDVLSLSGKTNCWKPERTLLLTLSSKEEITGGRKSLSPFGSSLALVLITCFVFSV